MKTHLLVAACLLVLSVGCSGDDSGPGPGETVKMFFDHVQNGDADAAVQLTSDRAIADKGGAPEVKNFYASFLPEIKASGGLEVEIVHESIKGRVAVVTFNLRYGNGQIEKNKYRIIKEHGKWKFDGKA